MAETQIAKTNDPKSKLRHGNKKNKDKHRQSDCWGFMHCPLGSLILASYSRDMLKHKLQRQTLEKASSGMTQKKQAQT